MAINVLLDTCILYELFSATGFGGYLKQIVSWQKSGEINLYCPESLLAEWNIHRQDRLKKIDSILKKHKLDLKKITLFELPVDIGDAQFSVADKKLRSQVEVIDQMLADATQVSDSPALGKMWEHKKAGKAPFRIKKESHNDAIILFATLEELIKFNEDELYFFSSNHKEYAAQHSLKHLHQDILESYPNLSVRYFHMLSEGISALLDRGLTSSKAELGVKSPLKNLVKVDQALPLFDQIYQYMEKRFADIQVLPKHLFVPHYPFLKNGKNTKDAAPFTLSTDDPAVYNLFIEFAENTKSGNLDWSATQLDEKNQDRRIVEVVHLLRSCYVHHISLNYKTTELPYISADQCECLNCKFSRSEFSKVFKELDRSLPSTKADLKTAFLHYEIGNLQHAVEMLIQVASNAEKEQKWITFYIANYNLALIGRMFRFSGPDGREEKWVKELLEIDMENILNTSRSSSVDDILDFIKDAGFLSRATAQITELTIKIKNNWIDRNRGWNDYLRSLLDVYFETMGFVEHNFFMLDYFSDLNSLTYQFIDGTFASYASHPELGGRILHFTDAIVQHIVSYGKTDDIIKCRNRYDIRIAEYQYGGSQSILVTELCNLLDSYQQIIEHFDKTEHPGQRFFWKRFRIKFHNSLTMSSMLKVSKEEVNLICVHLLPFIKIEKHFNGYELLKTLSYFIKNNAGLIEKNYLEDFVLFAYTTDNEQREVLIHTISNISRIEDLELKLTKDQWIELQARYLVNMEIQRDSNIVSEICCLFDFLKEKEYKDEIAKFMTDYLKFKFNSNVYYTAAIHKLIKPTSKLNTLYDKEMLKRARDGRRPRIFESSFYNSDTLDEYINFMFCFNRQFDARFIQAAGAIDNYYRWILNIEGYDYNEFNPDWLFTHLTKYYRNQFRNSKMLKYWIRKSALNSKSPNVGRFYIEMYTDSII